MIYLLDTGPLVAAFRRPEDKDPFTPWAAKLIRSLPYPLFTCDAVLAEAAHFLRSPAKLLEAVKRGLLVSRFDQGMKKWMAFPAASTLRSSIEIIDTLRFLVSARSRV